MPLGCRGIHERAIRHGLGRYRAEPKIADGVAASQTGKNRQHRRREDAHDLRRHGALQHRPTWILRFPGQRRCVVGQKAAIRRHRGGGRAAGAEKLLVGCGIALARVGARHEVGVRSRGLDRKNADGVAARVQIGFGTREPFERMAGRGYVLRILIEKPKHVVEGPILEHQDDDVVDRHQLVGRHDDSSAMDPRFTRVIIIKSITCMLASRKTALAAEKIAIGYRVLTCFGVKRRFYHGPKSIVKTGRVLAMPMRRSFGSGSNAMHSLCCCRSSTWGSGHSVKSPTPWRPSCWVGAHNPALLALQSSPLTRLTRHRK